MVVLAMKQTLKRFGAALASDPGEKCPASVGRDIPAEKNPYKVNLTRRRHKQMPKPGPAIKEQIPMTLNPKFN